MYTFSDPTNTKCQQIQKFKNYAFGQLKLSDASYFMIGYGPYSNNLHMYKLTLTPSKIPPFLERRVY